MLSDEVRAVMKVAGCWKGEVICGRRNLAVVALPMIDMCDSRDLGGVVDSANLGTSTLILYDRYPGGLGYSETGLPQHQPLAAGLLRNGRRLRLPRRLPQLRGTAEPATCVPL